MVFTLVNSAFSTRVKKPKNQITLGSMNPTSKEIFIQQQRLMLFSCCCYVATIEFLVVGGGCLSDS
jgi:hypothetical protein